MGDELPICIGTYEDGHESCDGGGEAVIGACGLRDLCRRFRDWCKENGVAPEAGRKLTLVGLEQYMRGEYVPQEKEPRRRPTPKRVAAAERLEKCRGLLAHFETLLRDRYGDERFAGQRDETRRRVIFKGGTFYSVDRTERSRYVVWYCKTDAGFDRAVACVHMRALTGLVDVQLPFTPEEIRKRLSKVSADKLGPVELEDGQFKSMCRGLDAERVGLAVSAIKRFDERGWRPLPGYEG